MIKRVFARLHATLQRLRDQVQRWTRPETRPSSDSPSITCATPAGLRWENALLRKQLEDRSLGRGGKIARCAP